MTEERKMNLKCNIDYDKYNDITSKEEFASTIERDIEKLKSLLNQKIMNVEKYSDSIKDFEKKVEDLITNCDDNSVYYLENKYRAGTEDTSCQTEGIFKSKIALEVRIESFMDRIWEYTEEDVCECMWWEITKYVDSEGYKKLYTIYLSADKKPIRLEFENDNKHLLNIDERIMYYYVLLNGQSSFSKSLDLIGI